jgi:2-dehydro-3-deoxy-D-arabinonate dehydratase
MKLYRTLQGPVVEDDSGAHRLLQVEWDVVFNSPDLALTVASSSCMLPDRDSILPPIDTQEVWASGVTYYRSRDARIEEAQQTGGGDGDFYAKVYSAERPELFFKSTAFRVVGPHQPVRIRKDSNWNVPEPELALVISNAGQIVGYTIGNDMSSRDIEGENPLYLPQAKVYDGSCALGPCLYLSREPLPVSTQITLEIFRHGNLEFAGSTTISQIKRSFSTLVEYLFREMSFPTGCFLLTGTGIVPSASFSLQSGGRSDHHHRANWHPHKQGSVIRQLESIALC